MKKEFFEIELHSIIFNKEQKKYEESNTKYDFDTLWYETYSHTTYISEKYPILEKNLEAKWKNDLQVIPKDLFKTSVLRLIAFVKKQPIDDKKYYW